MARIGVRAFWGSSVTFGCSAVEIPPEQAALSLSTRFGAFKFMCPLVIHRGTGIRICGMLRKFLEYALIWYIHYLERIKVNGHKNNLRPFEGFVVSRQNNCKDDVGLNTHRVPSELLETFSKSYG